MRFNRVALSISLHGPLLTHSNYSASTSIYHSLLSHSIHPSALRNPLSWSVCQGFLCYISVSIHLSESLSLFRGHVPSQIDHITPSMSPSYHTDPPPHSPLYTSGCIDKTIHQPLSLCLTYTQTSILTYKGVFCNASVHSSLVTVFTWCTPFFFCFLLCICPSICLHPPQSKHIPVLRLCFQDNVLIQLNSIFVAVHGNAPPLHYHSNGKLSPFITALINATYTYERAHTHTYH